MTPVSLQKDLNNFLEKNVAKTFEVKYTDKNGNEHIVNPTVVTGWIIPELQNAGNSENLKHKENVHIATRIEKIVTDPDARIVTIKITVGVQSHDALKSGDCAGYIDICNILERITQELLKNRVIGNKYRVSPKTQVDIPNVQPYPYWLGSMLVDFTMATIVEENMKHLY